jgi:hypothetical protein
MPLPASGAAAPFLRLPAAATVSSFSSWGGDVNQPCASSCPCASSSVLKKKPYCPRTSAGWRMPRRGRSGPKTEVLIRCGSGLVGEAAASRPMPVMRSAAMGRAPPGSSPARRSASRSMLAATCRAPRTCPAASRTDAGGAIGREASIPGGASSPVQAAPIATAPWGNQAVAAAATGNRRMPRATIRPPATHSLTTPEAIFLVVPAAGRAVGAAQAA